MTEVLQIIFFSILFSSLLFLPFNVFSTVNFLSKTDIIERTTLNFVINLNFLLFLSFLPLSIQLIQPIVLTVYSLTLIIINKNNIKSILKFLRLFLPLLIIFIILAINISSELFLGWDAKYFYYIKSLFFYEAKSIFDLNQFEHSHWHPHFGSYLWGFFWNLSFVDLEYFGRLFYLFLFCYSFFIVSKIFQKDTINNLIFLSLILLAYEYNFFSGLQEVLIFSILIILSKYFFLITNNNNNVFLFSILLFSNLLIWIKSEGIVYFLIMLSLLLLQNQISTKKKILLTSLFTFFYILKLLVYEITDIDGGQSAFYNFEYIQSLNLDIIFYKLANIIIWFLYYLSNNIFFLLFIFLIIYEVFFTKKDIKKNQKYYFSILIYLIFIIIFILFAYIFRDMEIVYAIRTTMDRLLMTASGFFVYPIVRLLFNQIDLKLDKFKI